MPVITSYFFSKYDVYAQSIRPAHWSSYLTANSNCMLILRQFTSEVHIVSA